MEIIIDCPLVGWWRKHRIAKLARLLRIPWVLTNPHVHYRLFLRFLGISDVAGDLLGCLSEQFPQGAKNLCLEVEHIGDVQVGTGARRFYLGCDSRNLEFTYQSGIFRQVSKHAIPD